MDQEKRRSELFQGWVDANLFCKELFSEYSFRLPDYCIVFQAEVVAFKVTVDLLLRNATSFRKVSIHSDSRAIIVALS